MNAIAFPVLRRLSDGGFQSGEAIARELGVSRGSVWNALREVERAGLRVFKVPGRGYCLPDPLDWLDHGGIRAELREWAGAFDIEIVDCAESTSSLLLERAAAEPSGKVIAAELQTAGRGRRGRAWHCGLGEGLTFSLLWRFSRGAGFLAGLSLAVGVALVRAFDELGASGAGLKWPNDVMHGSRKLAGTLIDIQGEIQGPSTAVIGIGINVRLGPTAKAHIDQPVIDLAGVAGNLPRRSQALGAVLRHLARVLAQFETGGFAPFVPEWMARHSFQDRKVALLLPDGSSIEGTARGIDHDGAFLLHTASGLRRFLGGEVSLRERA
jgi:BirA family transcriptional regulator, biotin operon repressor / biotin---[acetyl-CoA-carboxylase] ligase